MSCGVSLLSLEFSVFQIVRSSNLSGTSLLKIEETCTYSPCPDAPFFATRYHQEARITAFLPFLSTSLENHTVQILHIKSKQGMQVVEKLCQRIEIED